MIAPVVSVSIVWASAVVAVTGIICFTIAYILTRP